MQLCHFPIHKCLGNLQINEGNVHSKMKNFSPCRNDHPKIVHYVLYVLKVTPLKNNNCIHTMLGNFENGEKCGGQAYHSYENGTFFAGRFSKR